MCITFLEEERLSKKLFGLFSLKYFWLGNLLKKLFPIALADVYYFKRQILRLFTTTYIGILRVAYYVNIFLCRKCSLYRAFTTYIKSRLYHTTTTTIFYTIYNGIPVFLLRKFGNHSKARTLNKVHFCADQLLPYCELRMHFINMLLLKASLGMSNIFCFTSKDNFSKLKK